MDETRKAWAASIEDKKKSRDSDVFAFHKLYVEGLSYMTARVELLRSQPTEELRQSILKEQLKWMVAVLGKYCRLEGRGKGSKI